MDAPDGNIWKGNLQTGEGEEYELAAPGPAVGLDHDRRSGYLFVAGGLLGVPPRLACMVYRGNGIDLLCPFLFPLIFLLVDDDQCAVFFVASSREFSSVTVQSVREGWEEIEMVVWHSCVRPADIPGEHCKPVLTIVGTTRTEPNTLGRCSTFY